MCSCEVECVRGGRVHGSPLPAPLGALVCVSGLGIGFMVSGSECGECRWQERERKGGGEGEVCGCINMVCNSR